MAAKTSGVQRLLEAEKEATKIVQKARQYRIQRAKEAREEAEHEIEALREQRKRELEMYEHQHVGDAKEEETRVAADTEQKLAQLREAFQDNRAAVIQKLLEAVTTVNPTVHANVRPGTLASTK